VSPRISPHTTASRDSMIPSVTNGAIIGSAASKKHEKLPRGSSATMIVLPRNHREQHGNLPKLLTDDRENGANIPGGVSEAYAGRDGPSNIPGHSAQTHLHSVAAAISPTGTASRAASCKDLCACAEHIHWEWHVGCAAHHTHQPWRGGCRRPCWRDLILLNGSLYLAEWAARPGWELPHVSGQSAAPSCSSLRLIACCHSGEARAQVSLAPDRLDSGL
jgi:hypothetical protein